ncbi:MAG: family 16 glycoside hydrolase [Bryobacteraceae bacterium]
MSRPFFTPAEIYLCTALSVFAQTPAADSPEASETEVRQVVDAFLKAVREGNNAQVRKLVSDTVKFVNAGGTERNTANVMELLGRPAPVFGTNRANLVRRIQFLTPDVALAYGLTRDPKDRSQYGAATFTLALVRKQGRWLIEARRDANIPSPDAVDPGPVEPIAAGDTLTAEEVRSGWRVLFDGKTFAGWTTLDGRQVPAAWHVESGQLRTIANSAGADLRTTERFTSFELRFEWQVAKKANSGVKYRLFGTSGTGGGSVGYEYQIADDDGDAGAIVDPKQRSGALYGILPVRQKAVKPLGEWNQSKLIVTRDHLEHWLNGVKIVEQPIDVPFASPIVVQYHRSEVGFRNLKIRPIADQ